MCKGRNILLGAQPDDAAYDKFIATVAAECGITPIIREGSSNLTCSRLVGDYGEVLALIENSGREAEATIPFVGVDIPTGRTVTAGQRLAIAPYDCWFIKKNA